MTTTPIVTSFPRVSLFIDNEKFSILRIDLDGDDWVGGGECPRRCCDGLGVLLPVVGDVLVIRRRKE